MEQSGEYAIPAPRSVVWTALNDPQVLHACIEGCETLSQTGENAYAAQVKAKVGPVSARFRGAVTLDDLNPPESYRMRIEAEGGAAGFGRGEAAVALEEAPDGTTVLRYTVGATVGGKLAQIGSRLINGATRKMADRFFAAFSLHMASQLAGERRESAPPKEQS